MYILIKGGEVKSSQVITADMLKEYDKVLDVGNGRMYSEGKWQPIPKEEMNNERD